MPSALDEAVELLEKQLATLDSQITDLNSQKTRVEGAVKELRPKPAGKRSPGRPRGSSKAARKAPTKRRRGSGGKLTRADQAVKLITDKPGISASDIAKAMKIKPNYLYRVLGDLEKEGRVTKDGRQYSPKG